MLYIWNLFNIKHQLYLNKKNYQGINQTLYETFFPGKIKKKFFLTQDITITE